MATCGEFLIFLPHLQLLVVRRCFSPDKNHRFLEEFGRVILSEHLYGGTRSAFLNLCKQTCVRKAQRPVNSVTRLNARNLKLNFEFWDPERDCKGHGMFSVNAPNLVLNICKKV